MSQLPKDETKPSLCALCSRVIDFTNIESLDVQILRGQIVDEDHDEDDQSWSRGLYRAFCSEAHFQEWATTKTFPPVEEWDDWSPSEGNLTGCAAVALVSIAVGVLVIGLAIFGVVSALQAIL